MTHHNVSIEFSWWRRRINAFHFDAICTGRVTESGAQSTFDRPPRAFVTGKVKASGSLRLLQLSWLHPRMLDGRVRIALERVKGRQESLANV
jgi:hypothetical protein